MKTLKLFAAGLLALASATLASATTTIHIVGSTAFRSSVHAAIINMLNSPTCAYSGSALSKAGQATFTGTLKSGNSAGQTVIIEADWTGSTGGIQSVAQSSPAVTKPFLTTGNTMTSVSLSGTAGSYTFNGGNNVAAVTTSSSTCEVVSPEVTMSDSFQGSSIFTGTVVLTAISNTTTASEATLVDNVVGVVPFEWVRGNSNTFDGTTTASSNFANVANITTQQAIDLLNGGLPLSQFTSNAADDAAGVFVFGRDEDSGTRLDTFAETGFGIQSTPDQYQPTVGTGTLAGVITALNPWPSNAVNSITYSAGHSGYNSGGTLAGDLGRLTTPSLASFVIGYLGTGDAATAIAAGGVALTYNGVTYSPTAVQQGQYTFWSYEHLMYLNTYSGVGKDAALALAAQIHSVDAAQAGVLLSTMTVGRGVEGGPVTFVGLGNSPF